MNRNVKRLISLFVVSWLFIAYQNCDPFKILQEDIGSVSDVDYFVGLYENVFEPKCLSCHGATNAAGGINLSDYDSIMASNTIVTGNAQGSLLYTTVLSSTETGHETLSPSELEGLANWIDAGALENELPVANAGPDRNISLPTSTVTLEGQAQDRDGTIANYLWEQQTGPNTAQIINGTNRIATFSGLVAGAYVFELTVTDNMGGMGSDAVTVTVAEGSNSLPTINTGGTRSLTLPTNSISIQIEATDSDGTIASYAWTQVSGPNTATLSGITTHTLMASHLIEGSYQFRITVTDNRGGAAMANVTVNVAAAAPAVTYTRLRSEILFYCTGCHGNSGNYNMQSYAQVMTRVVPNNAAQSLFYQRVMDNSMPPGSPLNTAERNLIRDWINAGALNN